MDATRFEHPDDPRPVSADALHARKVAIREGKTYAPPRDEFEPAVAAAAAAAPVAPLEVDVHEDDDELRGLFGYVDGDGEG